MLALIGMAVVVALWGLAASVSDPLRLPGPAAVWEAFRADWNVIPALQYAAFQSDGISDGVVYTAGNVLFGLAVGSLAGFAVGALLGQSRLARELLQVPMLVLSTMPVLILLPFLLQWFGTARLVQSGLVIVFAFVTVAAVVHRATLEVGGRYGDYAASLGASPTRIATTVLFPGALPATLGAVRVAAAAAWSFECVAELIGGQRGAGKLIQAMQSQSATADIMATVIAVGIAALILDAAIAAAGAWIVRWKEQS